MAAGDYHPSLYTAQESQPHTTHHSQPHTTPQQPQTTPHSQPHTAHHSQPQATHHPHKATPGVSGDVPQVGGAINQSAGGEAFYSATGGLFVPNLAQQQQWRMAKQPNKPRSQAIPIVSPEVTTCNCRYG